MSNREASNRIVKALAIAQVLFEAGVAYEEALAIKVNQGPFWNVVCQKTGHKTLSEATRMQACYFLAAMLYKARNGRKPV